MVRFGSRYAFDDALSSCIVHRALQVHEIPAVADGNTIEFPSTGDWLTLLYLNHTNYNHTGLTGITFTVPKNLPSGEYLSEYLSRVIWAFPEGSTTY